VNSKLQGIFHSELERATEMSRQGRPRYWLAYCRGLRRGFGGASAVPDDEHHRWLGLHPALRPDEIAGYGDALVFAAGVIPSGAPASLDHTGTEARKAV
jgi:hypothetical protein